MPSHITSRYAVIIDAGSSGSRLYVYQWPSVLEYRAVHAQNVTIMNGLPPISTSEDWSIKTKPGISSFHDKTADQIWRQHLKQLIDKANRIVPEEERYRTPVYFLATAGMRLLKLSEQEKILGSVCGLLKTHSEFYLPECETHVSVIDGETEGLYGWLALNYLLDSTQTFQSDRETYGFMDMGGASAQIAFMPNATESKRHEEDLFRVTLRRMSGESRDFDVFVSTWLGFGANESRRRLLDRLRQQERASDPCTVKGLKMDVANSTHTVYGTGNFGECLKEIEPLLNKHLKCKDEPCLFNGVHVPAIDYTRERFIGVSEYWYTANDVFDMGGKYDFSLFTTRAREFCELGWDQVLQNHANGRYGDIPQEYLEHACFKAAWVVSILHEGFLVPVDGNKNKHIDRDGQDRNVAHHPVLRRGHEIDFEDPFQSALTINGNELSWTLGRAMMYASSEIPGDHIKSKEPGYLAAGSSQFVRAGELEQSPAPAMFFRASIDLYTLGMVSLVAVLMYFLYRVRHRLNYKMRDQIERSSGIRRLRYLMGKANNNYEYIDGRNTNGETQHDNVLWMEEDGIMTPSDISLKSYPSSPMLNGLQRKRSNMALGRSTSMLNLAVDGQPSRVSSRINLRMADRPVSSCDVVR